jgi:hypothetical protein
MQADALWLAGQAHYYTSCPPTSCLCKRIQHHTTLAFWTTPHVCGAPGSVLIEYIDCVPGVLIEYIDCVTLYIDYVTL